MWFNGLEATGECLQSFDDKGEMQGRHTSHVTTAVYFRQLEKIITRKRWKCFWPDWLVTTSASAAFVKETHFWLFFWMLVVTQASVTSRCLW